MHANHDPEGGRRRVVGPPSTPAQVYALLAGGLLASGGILALVLTEVEFGTVGPLAEQPEFLIWAVSGWMTILWIAMGGVGLLSMARLDTARIYALFAGTVFTVVAVWGFIDGNDVAAIIPADTTNNVTHAVVAALGLLAGSIPTSAQRPQEPVQRTSSAARTRRFESVGADEPTVTRRPTRRR